MRAVAWCSLGNADPEPLAHGDLIGRASSAAMVVDDARVSEAHAFVSLRGGRLRLLALRGRFRVGANVVAEVELAPGVEVELAEGLVLAVVDVVLPATVLGIEGPGLAPLPLPGTISLDVRPTVRVRPGWHPDAAAVLWSLDDAWRVTVAGQAPRPVSVGEVVELDGISLRLVAVPLSAAGLHRTIVDLAVPLRIEAAFHTVRVLAQGAAPVVIGGVNGRILAELVAFEGPVGWRVVAGEVWGADTDVDALRRRWDAGLGRLRARLRMVGVRDDLVHTDGAGHVELLLRPGDVAVTLDG